MNYVCTEMNFLYLILILYVWRFLLLFHFSNEKYQKISYFDLNYANINTSASLKHGVLIKSFRLMMWARAYVCEIVWVNGEYSVKNWKCVNTSVSFFECMIKNLPVSNRIDQNSMQNTTTALVQITTNYK